MKQINGKSANARRGKESKRRRNTLLIGFLMIGGGILILASMVLYSITNSSAGNPTRVKIGAPLGNFTLTDLTGKSVHLSDYAGKAVLINAWATWCPPCKAEMPTLTQYYQAHRNQGFVLLAVNAGDSQNTPADFVSQNGLSFPVLLDPGASVLDAMGINDFPTSVLVGRDGIVKTVHLGSYTSQTLESEITPFLQ
jgi:thiol-disulfide isomerase/thioredoxin